MINSKDTKVIKELVVSALLQGITNTQKENCFSTYLEMTPIVEKAFDIVIDEMEQGKI